MEGYADSREAVMEKLNERFRELLMEYLTDRAYQTEPGKYNWHPAIELADQCVLGEQFPDDGIYGWLSEGEWYPNSGYNPGRWAYKQARDALIKEIISGDTLTTQLYFIAGSGKENIGPHGKGVTCGVCALFEGRILNESELQEAISMGLFHPHCVHYAVPIIETEEILDIINRTGD